jgi:hypothetical protein
MRTKESGTVRTIDAALRRAAQGGYFTVAVLGGSVTAGLRYAPPYSNTIITNHACAFSGKLERWLRAALTNGACGREEQRRRARRIRVLNMAVRGTTTASSAPSFLSKLASLSVDLVVLDFSANDKSNTAGVERLEPVARSLACLPGRPSMLWLETNHFDHLNRRVPSLAYGEVAERYWMAHLDLGSLLESTGSTGRLAAHIEAVGIHVHEEWHQYFADAIASVLAWRLDEACDTGRARQAYRVSVPASANISSALLSAAPSRDAGAERGTTSNCASESSNQTSSRALDQQEPAPPAGDGLTCAAALPEPLKTRAEVFYCKSFASSFFASAPDAAQVIDTQSLPVEV